MFVRKLFTTSLLIVAVFATTFAGRSVSAQSTPAGTCTDVGYAGPIATAQAVLQNASYSKPNTVGSALCI